MRSSCGQGRQRRRRGRLQRQKRRMGGRVLEVEWGLGDTLGKQGVTFISYTEWLVKMQGKAKGLGALKKTQNADFWSSTLSTWSLRVRILLPKTRAQGASDPPTKSRISSHCIRTTKFSAAREGMHDRPQQ